LLFGSETRLGRREHSVPSRLREFHAPATITDSSSATLLATEALLLSVAVCVERFDIVLARRHQLQTIQTTIETFLFWNHSRLWHILRL